MSDSFEELGIDKTREPAPVPKAREGEPTIAVGLNGEYSTFTLKDAAPTHEGEVEPDFSKLPAEIVAFVKSSQYAWDAWQESGAQDGSIPDIQWWMCAAIADYTRQLSSGGEVVEAARKYPARLGFQYWTIVEAAGFAAEYARQLQERCGELAEDLALAKGEAVRLRGLAEDAWKRAKKLDTLLVGTRSNLRHFRGKVEAAEQARKVAEDKVVELERSYVPQNIASELLDMLTEAGCGKPGTPNTLWAMVQEIIHERDAAQGMVATQDKVIREVRFIASAAGHGPCRSGGIGEEGVCPNSCFCEWAKDINGALEALTLSAPIAEAHRFSPLGDNHHNAFKCPYCNPQAEAHVRQVASKALPKDIMDSVNEYLRLSAISPENFPGHRSTALLNLVAHIGERLVGVVARTSAQDIADGKRAAGSYLATRAEVLRARAQDFEARKRDAGL